MANIKVQISNILSESKTLRNSKYKIKLREKKRPSCQNIENIPNAAFTVSDAHGTPWHPSMRSLRTHGPQTRNTVVSPLMSTSCSYSFKLGISQPWNKPHAVLYIQQVPLNSVPRPASLECAHTHTYNSIEELMSLVTGVFSSGTSYTHLKKSWWQGLEEYSLPSNQEAKWVHSRTGLMTLPQSEYTLNAGLQRNLMDFPSFTRQMAMFAYNQFSIYELFCFC